MADDVFSRGMEVRRDMWGEAGADRQIEAATEFNGPFQDIITRYCFGEVWNRTEIDRKTRSMLTLAILGTLGKPNQLRTHVRGAIANGVTTKEIREVLIHVMVYAGVPAAADAFINAQDELKQMGLD